MHQLNSNLTFHARKCCPRTPVYSQAFLLPIVWPSLCSQSNLVNYPSSSESPQLSTSINTSIDTNRASQPSQTLPQPITQLRLSKLRQIIHALLTQIDTLQLRNILRGRLTNSLHNNRRIGLENNTIVDYLINRQCY